MRYSGSDSPTACACSAGRLAAAVNACCRAASSEAGKLGGAVKSSDGLLSASASQTAAALPPVSPAEDISVCRVGTPVGAFS